MPLLKAPALALDCGWRTMMRLTGAISRQLVDMVVIEGVNAARMSLAANFINLFDHFQRILKAAILERLPVQHKVFHLRRDNLFQYSLL